MSKQNIENEIQEKGLTAPRITPDRIDEVIVSEHYFTATDGELGAYRNNDDVYQGSRPSDQSVSALPLLTFCVLVLRNGFTVTGESACVSPENFDAEIGRKVAKENAESKIWELEGYALKQKLHEESCLSSDLTANIKPTQDRKYGINEQGELCNIATGVPIPADEPVFMLRAKDMLAEQTLQWYLSTVVTGEHKEAVKHRLDDFTRFRLANPDLMKAPDTVYPFPKATG